MNAALKPAQRMLGWACALLSLHVLANEHHVSPGGQSTNAGTVGSPWDLETALAHPTSVQPGDIIWLHGGTYPGTYVSHLAGSQSAPIQVRQYPGERALIDPVDLEDIGLTISAAGHDTWYWGFEIAWSRPRRTNSSAGLMAVHGARTKLINLVLHDSAGGVGFWVGAQDAEAYGNIIYHVGYHGSDRGHGHGIYAQNRYGKKWIADNLIFGGYNHGIHAYTENGYLNGIEVEGNIVFQSGVLATTSGFARNVLVGGGQLAQDPVVRANSTYFDTAVNGGENNVGYAAGCNQSTVQDNYFVGGSRALRLVNCPATVTGNTFYAFSPGIDAAVHPANTFHSSRPRGVRSFVRPNRYEPNRSHLTVYNWDRLEAVQVDLSAVLTPGDVYEIHDVQNLFGPPVASGTYPGGLVEVPMNSTAISPPRAYDSTELTLPVMTPSVHTDKEFGAFLVRVTAEGPPPSANASPSVQAGTDLTVVLPAVGSLRGVVTDDGLPSAALTHSWSVVSGPGAVTFGDESQLSTAASFAVPGTYVLRLSASDGALQASDAVTVLVLAEGEVLGGLAAASRIVYGGCSQTGGGAATWPVAAAVLVLLASGCARRRRAMGGLDLTVVVACDGSPRRDSEKQRSALPFYVELPAVWPPQRAPTRNPRPR